MNGQLVLALIFVFGVAAFGVTMVVLVVRASDRRREYRRQLLAEVRRLRREEESD